MTNQMKRTYTVNYCPECGQYIRNINGKRRPIKFRGFEFEGVICNSCIAERGMSTYYNTHIVCPQCEEDSLIKIDEIYWCKCGYKGLLTDVQDAWRNTK